MYLLPNAPKPTEHLVDVSKNSHAEYGREVLYKERETKNVASSMWMKPNC